MVLVCSIQNTLTGNIDTRYNLRVGNGSIDTGSNYSNTFIIGNGSTAARSRNTGRSQIDGIINTPTSDSGEFALIKFDLLNYSNTTTYKTILYRDGKTQNTQEKGAGAGTGIWRSTSAIDTLSIFTSGPSTGTFSVGSTFTIYGILKEA